MDLSLPKLQHLVAVATCGSFSRAATELNLSQPALSRSIAGIEDRYGFAIFNRVGHGVELTAAGLQVLEQARPVLRHLQVLDSNMRLIAKGRSGRLALGMAPLLGLRGEGRAPSAGNHIGSTRSPDRLSLGQFARVGHRAQSAEPVADDLRQLSHPEGCGDEH